jgi:hypothetical protein
MFKTGGERQWEGLLVRRGVSEEMRGESQKQFIVVGVMVDVGLAVCDGRFWNLSTWPSGRIVSSKLIFSGFRADWRLLNALECI